MEILSCTEYRPSTPQKRSFTGRFFVFLHFFAKIFAYVRKKQYLCILIGIKR